MKLFRLAPIALAFALGGCSVQSTAPQSKETVSVQSLLSVPANLEASNPFLNAYKTPYGVPDFTAIRDEHYLPTFVAAMAQQKAQIAAIVANPDAPSFANTIEAFEFSGGLLTRVSDVFFNLRGSSSNDEIRKISKEVIPMLSAHQDDVFLNQAFFKRVKAVYDKKETFNLTIAQTRLLNDFYQEFVRGGANLNAQDKDKYRELNKELSSLSLQFGDNVLQETKSFEYYVTDKAMLSGIPDSVVASAAQSAADKGKEGQWLFIASRPSVTPVITFADNRELREAMYKGYTMRGDNDNANDNKVIVAKMASLRAERAQLLGFETHAHYVLGERTAQTPEAVYALLEKIWPAALAKAKEEVKDIQAYIDNEKGGFKAQAWDYLYYAEKIRKDRYDLDEQEIKAYFSLDATLDGVFYAASRLYGLQFKERKDIPVYNPDVRAFEINDKDGSFIGIYYADFYVRDGKRGGAWMSSFQKQSNMNGEYKHPFIVNVLNYPKPVGDKPVLLTFDQASTLFHEFGHALHGLLSEGNYLSQTGTSVPRDYVEFPSQVNENWMTEPEVLSHFAKHYQTGEVIPKKLIDKINAASKFNAGFATVEYMAATYLDLDWHSLKDTEIRDAREFEKKSLASIGLIDEIAPRYRSTYFQHIFSGGYSAGYYSYIWADQFGADGYEAFRENGAFDQKTANAFREHVLSKGGTDDVLERYRRFRGADPKIEPLLRSRGLID